MVTSRSVNSYDTFDAWEKQTYLTRGCILIGASRRAPPTIDLIVECSTNVQLMRQFNCGSNNNFRLQPKVNSDVGDYFPPTALLLARTQVSNVVECNLSMLINVASVCVCVCCMFKMPAHTKKKNNFELRNECDDPIDNEANRG